MPILRIVVGESFRVFRVPVSLSPDRVSDNLGDACLSRGRSELSNIRVDATFKG